jgi:hypothetical protein
MISPTEATVSVAGATLTNSAHASEISWVEPLRLRGRLDASFYAPKYLRLDAALDKFEPSQIEPLGNFLKAPRRVLYMHTQTYEGQDAPPNSIPFFSGGDLDGAGCTLNWSGPALVDSWMAEKYPKGLLFAGALLVKVKGPNQSAAYVENLRNKALVSGTILFSGTSGIDPYYLVLFLCSSHGTEWRTRLRTNLTVEFVSNDDLKEVPVLRLPETIQRGMGNYLRKAERLRELSEVKWAAAVALLSRAIGTPLTGAFFENFDSLLLSDRSYRLLNTSPPIAWAVARDRIGAQLYHPRRVHAQRTAGRIHKVEPLSKLAKRTAKRADAEAIAKSYVGLDRIDSHLGVISRNIDQNAEAEAGAVAFGPGAILFSRLRPYLNKVAICPPYFGNGCGSTELMVYQAEAGIHPFYLFLTLKSALGLYQVLDITTGSTHPRVSPEDVDEILVPRLERALEDQIGELVSQAHQHWYLSRELVADAREKIDALIAGNLDETALSQVSGTIETWLAANPSPFESK